MLRQCLFLVKIMEKTRTISIYIHFPYCVRKCKYCDFISFPCGADFVFPDDFCDYYVREIESLCKNIPGIFGRRVKSIYFGGGTPSLMPVGWCERIIEAVCRNFIVSDDVEVTLEMNPATNGWI